MWKIINIIICIFGYIGGDANEGREEGKSVDKVV